MRSFLVLMVLYCSVALGWQEVPPAHVTGSVCTESDPDFVGYRYSERIPYCKRNVSSATKDRIYHEAGIPLSQKGQFTIDHFTMLSVGGTNHLDNLWPEPKYVKDRRGNLEFNLFQGMESGCLPQSTAIEIITESKLNLNIMLDRPYASYETMYDYATDRGIDVPECTKWIFTSTGYGN